MAEILSIAARVDRCEGKLTRIEPVVGSVSGTPLWKLTFGKESILMPQAFGTSFSIDVGSEYTAQWVAPQRFRIAQGLGVDLVAEYQAELEATEETEEVI